MPERPATSEAPIARWASRRASAMLSLSACHVSISRRVSSCGSMTNLILLGALLQIALGGRKLGLEARDLIFEGFVFGFEYAGRGFGFGRYEAEGVGRVVVCSSLEGR